MGSQIFDNSSLGVVSKSDLIKANLDQQMGNTIILTESQFQKAIEEHDLEIYEEVAVLSFRNNLEKAIDADPNDLEKAKKDLSKLIKTTVVGKDGVKRIVYVKRKEYKSHTEGNRAEIEATIKRQESLLANPKSPASAKKRAQEILTTEKGKLAKMGGEKQSKDSQDKVNNFERKQKLRDDVSKKPSGTYNDERHEKGKYSFSGEKEKPKDYKGPSGGTKEGVAVINGEQFKAKKAGNKWTYFSPRAQRWLPVKSDLIEEATGAGSIKHGEDPNEHFPISEGPDAQIAAKSGETSKPVSPVDRRIVENFMGSSDLTMRKPDHEDLVKYSIALELTENVSEIVERLPVLDLGGAPDVSIDLGPNDPTLFVAKDGNVRYLVDTGGFKYPRYVAKLSNKVIADAPKQAPDETAWDSFDRRVNERKDRLAAEKVKVKTLSGFVPKGVVLKKLNKNGDTWGVARLLTDLDLSTTKVLREKYNVWTVKTQKGSILSVDFRDIQEKIPESTLKEAKKSGPKTKIALNPNKTISYVEKDGRGNIIGGGSMKVKDLAKESKEVKAVELTDQLIASKYTYDGEIHPIGNEEREDGSVWHKFSSKDRSSGTHMIYTSKDIAGKTKSSKEVVELMKHVNDLGFEMVDMKTVGPRKYAKRNAILVKKTK